MKRRLMWLALCVVGLLLSACSQETDLWLYEDEQWKVTAVVAFDPDILPTLSLGAEIIPGLELGADVPTYNEPLISVAMDRFVAYYEDMGVKARWHKRQQGREVVYTTEMEGQGWNLLQQVVTGQPAQQGQQSQTQSVQLSVKDMGNGQLHVVLDPGEYAVSMGMLFGQTYRFHGGQVISSNASQIQGGTAIWRTPQRPMEAVLTPASRFSLDIPVVLALVGGAVALLGGGAIVVYLLLRSAAPPPRRPGLRAPRRRPSSSRRPSGPQRRRR